MVKECFEHIDEVLGAGDGRFFSQGYRTVNHELTDLEIGMRQRQGFVQGWGTVTYPASWSRKGTAEPVLVPHLSSIDGLVLAVQLSEIYLATRFGLSIEQRQRMWVRQFAIKAGSVSTTALSRMPVSASHLSTQYETRTLCGNVSVLGCTVGSLSVRLEIEHEIGEWRRTEGFLPNAEQVLGAPSARYYGEQYKRQRQSIRSVQLDPEAFTSAALIAVQGDRDAAPMAGMQSFYLPAITYIDAIVVVAQLAQALLYRIDHIERAQSNNLWMREISASSKTPHLSLSPFIATTRIEKSRYVTMNRGRWRVAYMDAQFQGISTHYSVAHELPKAPASRAASVAA